MTEKYSRWISGLISAVLVITAVSGGYMYGRREAQAVQIPSNILGASVPAGVDEGADFAVFWKVWNLLDEKYGGTKGQDVTDQDKIYAAIQGLSAAYGDPYTTFFPPEETKSFQEEISGSFEGIGAEIALKDGYLTVVAPLKNSPSEKAGVKSGDRIISINGQTVSDMTLDGAIKNLKGKKGTTVTLSVLRGEDDQALELKVVRDVISIPTLDSERLPDGTFVIRLYNFTGTASSQFSRAMQQFYASGSKRLIVDLRGNPGGYLDAAVDAASWFVKEGDVIVTERFKSKKDNLYRSRGYATIPSDSRVVVLIDGGSASASEIFAGALQEYGIATLIGTRSFGKGSVQEYLNVTSNTSLKVTVAEWLTPKNNSISKEGLTPTIEVTPRPDDVRSGFGALSGTKDAQFERAIEFLNTGK
ncbi:MAG TPA: S41 family peptidase [Candidatus Paceibacterota bacterium]|nr:S41 family peptidase [Candidatus Paceibacterota bacterium]